MKNPTTHVSELNHFETLLQELLVLNGDNKRPWEVDIIPGADSIRIPNLPEFFFKQLTSEEMKKEGTKLPFLSYCTKATTRDLKKRVALQRRAKDILEGQKKCPGMAVLEKAGIKVPNGIPSLTSAGYEWYDADIPDSPPRYRGATLKEVYDSAQAISPYRMIPGTDAFDIPNEVMARFLAAWIVANARPGGCKADPHEALAREQARMEHLLDCKSLAQWCIRTDIDPNFIIENRFSYKAPHLKDWQRQKVRALCEFAEFAGTTPIDDFTPEMTPSCVAFARYVREVDNGAPLKEISLKKLIGSIRKMFDDAATIGLCKFNPFHFAPAGSQPKPPRKRIKPHKLADLDRLIETAWQMDKAICLAIILASWGGLRRCEIWRLTWGCINYKLSVIDIPDGEHKNNSKTLGRPVPMMPALRDLIQLFTPGAPDELIFGNVIGTYVTRMTAVREAAGFEKWGKDGLRKNYAIATQWLSLPLEIRHALLGHTPNSPVTVTFYDGLATSQWADDFSKRTRKEILGRDPAPCRPIVFA